MNPRQRVRSGLMAFMTGALVLLGTAVPGQATPVDVQTVDNIGKFYDNSLEGRADYILMAGPETLQDWCDDNLVSVALIVRDTKTKQFRTALGRVDIQLYDANGLSAPDFVGQACDTGVLPTPLGTGRGWLVDRVIVDKAAGTALNPNRVWGFVTTPAGTRVHVRGYALNALDSPTSGYPLTVTLTVSGQLGR